MLLNKKIKKKHKENQNPYLNHSGKRIWNDRYLNLSQARKHWQYMTIFLGTANIFLLILIFKLSTASSIRPFVVELSKGMPIGIASSKEGLPDNEKLTEYAINEFITNSRSIVGECEAQKHLLDKTYAFSANDTLNFLREYYTKHNPFEKAETVSVEVNVLNCLKIGKKMWQVTWDEIEKSKEGSSLVNESRFIGTLMIEQTEPNPKFLNINPFGIYVTKLSWTKIRG